MLRYWMVLIGLAWLGGCAPATDESTLRIQDRPSVQARLRQLHERFREEERREAHPCNRVELRGVDDATYRGCRLYHAWGCAACHGPLGRGDGDSPYMSQMRPRPTDLTNSSALRYWSDAERLQVIRDGILGTAMPAYREHLTEPQLRNLRALLPYLDWLRTYGHRIGT